MVTGDDAYGSTIAKDRLSRRLAELRVATKLTANQACDRLGWGRGKVGRFENNVWLRPGLSDIRDLARLYGVKPETAEELEELAKLARLKPWWRDYQDVFDNEFPGFEADAKRIWVYLPLLLPGLLQTPAYIDAHMTLGSKPPEWRERAKDARLRRQQILHRDDPPELVALVTEASLLYHWGALEDRRAQVMHLVELSELSNVEIRLLRFRDGPHPGMNGLINLFAYPEEQDPPIVYLETDLAVTPIREPAEVAAYAAMFNEIREAAAEPNATVDHLRRLAETLE